jgi:hypothetical protein
LFCRNTLHVIVSAASLVLSAIFSRSLRRLGLSHLQ